MATKLFSYHLLQEPVLIWTFLPCFEENKSSKAMAAGCIILPLVAREVVQCWENWDLERPGPNLQ